MKRLLSILLILHGSMLLSSDSSSSSSTIKPACLEKFVACMIGQLIENAKDSNKENIRKILEFLINADVERECRREALSEFLPSYKELLSSSNRDSNISYVEAFYKHITYISKTLVETVKNGDREGVREILKSIANIEKQGWIKIALMEPEIYNYPELSKSVSEYFCEIFTKRK